MCTKPLLNTSTNYNKQWQTKLKLERYVCSNCLGEVAWIDKVLCSHCGRSERCPDCHRRAQSSLLLNRSAVRYDTHMKQWLHRYKFQGDEQLTGLLGTMLLPAVEQVSLKLIQHYGLVNRWRASNKLPTAWLQKNAQHCWDAVTAVPLSEQRLRERGFNQAELLALVISEHCSIPYYNLLQRTHHSDIRHSHQGRLARVNDSKEMYCISDEGWHTWFKLYGSEIQQKRRLHVLVVDDVYTTGSTLHACADAMIRASSIPLITASVTWARS